MDNDKKEIRLDRTNDRAANEEDMPGDNTIKPSGTPLTGEGPLYGGNLRPSPSLDDSPDFLNGESEENTAGSA
jgi:hypothetical protein